MNSVKKVFLWAWIATSFLLWISWVNAWNIYYTEGSCDITKVSEIPKDIKSNSLVTDLLVNEILTENNWEDKLHFIVSEINWNFPKFTINADHLKITWYEDWFITYIKYLDWKTYLWGFDITKLWDNYDTMGYRSASDIWILYDVTELVNAYSFNSKWMDYMNYFTWHNTFDFFSYGKWKDIFNVKCWLNTDSIIEKLRSLRWQWEVEKNEEIPLEEKLEYQLNDKSIYIIDNLSINEREALELTVNNLNNDIEKGIYNYLKSNITIPFELDNLHYYKSQDAILKFFQRKWNDTIKKYKNITDTYLSQFNGNYSNKIYLMYLDINNIIRANFADVYIDDIYKKIIDSEV